MNIHVYLNVKYTAGGILIFNCDAFSGTLCALITYSSVYWCPFIFLVTSV